MIVEWLMQVAAGIWAWFGELMPDWTVPAAVSDPGGIVEQLVAIGAGMGVWLDWPTLTLIALAPLAVWVIGLAWKTLRMIVSHFPFFGGSG